MKMLFSNVRFKIPSLLTTMAIFGGFPFTLEKVAEVFFTTRDSKFFVAQTALYLAKIARAWF